MFIASNRGDIILSDTGQVFRESVGEYPSNAADSLKLLDTRGGSRAAATHPAKKMGARKKS
jgi:hypothetical protein